MLNTGKKWGLSFVIASVAALIAICALTAVIDPYFHYHAPLDGLQYPIDKERYQNDGIGKHFSYDAMITGTSMTENFKASECDALFGVTSVKTCFNGSSLREISNHLQRAVEANPEIRLIIRGYDGWNLFDDKDVIHAVDALPEYLYDGDLLNDTAYLLNKTILLQDTIGVLKHTLKGNATSTFDEYGNWNQWAQFGAETVLGGYERPEKGETAPAWSEEDAARLSESLYTNAIAIAQENPQIQFYYFFTPYSIAYMDEQNQYGILQRQMDAYRQASRELLAVENIHLFSFFNDYGTITNLENYYDTAHYHEDINSLILQRMAAGEYALTLDTYEAHWDEVEAFYLSYDYEGLFP